MLWKWGCVMLSYWDLIKSFKGQKTGHECMCRCKQQALCARDRPQHQGVIKQDQHWTHSHQTLRNVFDSLPASSSCCRGNAGASQRSYTTSHWAHPKRDVTSFSGWHSARADVCWMMTKEWAGLSWCRLIWKAMKTWTGHRIQEKWALNTLESRLARWCHKGQWYLSQVTPPDNPPFSFFSPCK